MQSVRLTFWLAAWAAIAPAQSPSYASFFGGEFADFGRAIAAIPSGGYYAAGTTTSRQGVFSSPLTGSRIFIARFTDRHELTWIRVLPASSVIAMKIDSAENLYLTGMGSVEPGLISEGTAYPTPLSNVPFLAKLDSTGSVVWATHLGTRTGLQVRALAISPSGRVGVCGFASSGQWPVLENAPVSTPPNRLTLAFCSVFSPDATRLDWSSVLSAVPGDAFPADAVFDEQERLHVVGSFSGTNGARSYPSAEDPSLEDPRRSLFQLSPDSPSWEPVSGSDTSSVLWLHATAGQLFWVNSSGSFATTTSGQTLRQSGAPAGRFVVHPLNQNYICAINSGRQLECSRDGGQTWSPQLFFSDVSSLEADPRHEGSYFFLSRNFIQRVNLAPGPAPAGLTFNPLLDQPVALHFAGNKDSLVIFILLATGRTFRSNDGGATFSPVSTDPGGLQRVFSAPGQSQTIYGLKRVWGESSLLQRSDDSGSTWTDVGPVWREFELASQPTLTEIFVDPANPMRLFLNHLSGSWLSTDGGQSWRSLHADLPNRLANAFAFSPDGIAYVATSIAQTGFLLTIDTGRNSIQSRLPLPIAGTLSWQGISPDGKGGYWLFGASSWRDLPVSPQTLTPRTPDNFDGIVANLNSGFEFLSTFSVGQRVAAFSVDPNGLPGVCLQNVASRWAAIAPAPPDARSSNAIVKLNSDHAPLVQPTPGFANNSCGSIAFAPSGATYLWGSASANQLVPTPNATQPRNAGGSDAALIELPPSLN